MIHNLITGGTELNFALEAGAVQPSSPVENTLWVNTSAAVTEWALSPKQPSPKEGLVWVCTGDWGPASFNALKKNTVQLYPLCAFICTDGEWVLLNASMYRNGEWAVLKPYLFAGGGISEFSAGWTSVGKRFDNADIVSTSVAPASITAGSNGAVIIRDSSGGGSFTYYNTMIDLTPYKTLHFEGTVHGFGSWSFIGLYPAMPAYSQSGRSAYLGFEDGVTVSGQFSLDVSALSGRHYVAFVLFDPDGVTPYFHMQRMWLE